MVLQDFFHRQFGIMSLKFNFFLIQALQLGYEYVMPLMFSFNTHTPKSKGKKGITGVPTQYGSQSKGVFELSDAGMKMHAEMTR